MGPIEEKIIEMNTRKGKYQRSVRLKINFVRISDICCSTIVNPNIILTNFTWLNFYSGSKMKITRNIATLLTHCTFMTMIRNNR
jgi:hypothetical protein